jgi:hypothetical protein
MSEQHNDAPTVIDLSEPMGPMELRDWIELYPTLPSRTISQCVWDANNRIRSHDGSPEDRNVAVAWLVSQQLEALRCAAAPV